MGFNAILEFEKALAEYTGAPYAIMTDCCTHAIELCLRLHKPKHVEFSAYTYLSIPMTMHKLGIDYTLIDEKWLSQYRFRDTNIWDSARALYKNMYRSEQMQCLSFGYDKPLSIGHGGAILLSDEFHYETLIKQRYDGRDLNISPWQTQRTFKVGYHYRPAIEDAVKGLELLKSYKPNWDEDPWWDKYPDLREITIED